MDLLDRYTHAVRTYLPKSLTEAQRNDIIAELSEESARAAGRPRG